MAIVEALPVLRVSSLRSGVDRREQQSVGRHEHPLQVDDDVGRHVAEDAQRPVGRPQQRRGLGAAGLTGQEVDARRQRAVVRRMATRSGSRPPRGRPR